MEEHAIKQVLNNILRYQDCIYICYTPRDYLARNTKFWNYGLIWTIIYLNVHKLNRKWR